MKKSNRMLCLALALLLFSGAFISCDNSPADTTAEPVKPVTTAEAPASSQTDAETQPPQVDNTIARFAVLSDSHIGKTNTDPENKLRHALDTLFAKDIYTVAFAGDITDRGLDSEYMEFMRILSEGKGKDAQYAICMGNHEYFRDGVVRYGGEKEKFLTECQNAYKEIVESELDTDITVGGVHIISLSARNSASDYKECEEFLITHLKAAAEENPSMPIIVVAHESAGACFEGGCGGFTPATVAELRKYPQVIFFSGHTHRPQNDPRMIVQDSYTTVQLGTVGADIWNYNDADTEQPEKAAECSQGVIVSVDKDGVVTIERYDFFHNEKIGVDWVIDTSAGKSGFKYSLSERTRAAKAPEFSSGAALAAGDAGAKSIVLRFPSAAVSDDVSDGIIYKYLLNAKYEGSDISFEKAVYADYFLGSAMGKDFEYKLSGLLPGKKYTVTVKAVTCFGKESNTLTTTFETLQAADVNAPQPDVIDIDYRQNSLEDKGPFSTSYETFGSPSLKEDALLGAYAAYCGTNDAYAYQLNNDIYAKVKNTITLETYLYIEKQQVYPWGYVDIVSNMEGAGFGFELNSGGELKFVVNNGAYLYASTWVTWESWVHLVGTYDGESIKLYVNGVLVSEKACTGAIKHTKAPSQKLFVGADTDGKGVMQTSANCRVAYVCMYSRALTSEEVYARYEIS